MWSPSPNKGFNVCLPSSIPITRFVDGWQISQQARGLHWCLPSWLVSSKGGLQTQARGRVCSHLNGTMMIWFTAEEPQFQIVKYWWMGWCWHVYGAHLYAGLSKPTSSGCNHNHLPQMELKLLSMSPCEMDLALEGSPPRKENSASGRSWWGSCNGDPVLVSTCHPEWPLSLVQKFLGELKLTASVAKGKSMSSRPY